MRKRPATAKETDEDFEVVAIQMAHAVTGKNIRAYLLAKGVTQKKYLLQVSPHDSKKYVQLAESLKREAESKIGDMRFLGLRKWAALRKMDLLQ